MDNQNNQNKNKIFLNDNSENNPETNEKVLKSGSKNASRSTNDWVIILKGLIVI